VIPTDLDEALVEGVRDDVVVVVAGRQDSVQEGLHLEARAHATELEVAQPQLAMRKAGLLSVRIEEVDRSLTHVDPFLIPIGVFSPSEGLAGVPQRLGSDVTVTLNGGRWNLAA
jgi:hypothetical protein